MSKRLFVSKHTMDYYESILAVDSTEIEKGYAFGDDMGATYAVPVGKVRDIKEYESIGGQIKNEDFFENHIVFSEAEDSDLIPEKWFFELLHRNYTFSYESFEKALEDYNEFEIDSDEPKITLEMLVKQFDKIESLYQGAFLEYCEEYYTYWDGSNHKTIWLEDENGERWEEVTDEPEYTIVETLDSKEHATGKTTTVKTESGSVYDIYESFFQGDITQSWTKANSK